MHWCADETMALIAALSMIPGIKFAIQKWMYSKIPECKCVDHSEHTHPARTTIIPPALTIN